MYKFKYIYIFVLTLLFLFSMPVSIVSAATKQSGDIKLTVDEPLFASTTNWYPGLQVSQTITVQNTGGDSKELSFGASNTSQTGSMAEVLYFNVRQGSTDLYGTNSSKTLQNFWDSGEVKILDMAGNTTKTLTLNIMMNSTAGNQYQGKQVQFDLNIGFIGEEPVTVSGSSGDVCGKAKPSVPGTLTGAVGPGDGQVTLTWTKPTTPPQYTYFLLAYSDDSNSPKWGNPDIGTDVVYTVSGLGSGAYYFWIRAGNGCMPGDFTGPVAVTLSSGAPGVVPGQPASGFAPGVLGESIENEAPDVILKDTNRENNGSVRGTEINNVLNEVGESVSSNWSPLLIIGGLLLFGVILAYWYLWRG